MLTFETVTRNITFLSDLTDLGPDIPGNNSEYP